ncbi:MAG: hypothetical protein RI531_09870 [Haloferacaceae archaeon]|nr:hypothetical protein [Haloferacaceae archaeon]
MLLSLAFVAAPAAAVGPVDASDVSYINISAPQNTTTQTVNITAIEGEDFAVSDGGTASITIEVGTSNPGLTIAPASARVVSATNASGGNATSAVSVSQTEYDPSSPSWAPTMVTVMPRAFGQHH